ERADPRQFLDGWRLMVVAADTHDLRTRPDRKQQLRHGGHETHDARRVCGLREKEGTIKSPAPCNREQDGRDRCDQRKQESSSRGHYGRPPARRTSSHKKNGPPIRAVTIPTGSSMGARTVRAIRSHATRNDPPT